MYFSTNLERGYEQIWQYYKARFQMEFNFRDGKQFMGLTNCQARSEEKMYYHYNSSLTADNIGKVISRQGCHIDQSQVIKIQDVLMELSSHRLLEFIISKLANQADFKLNEDILCEVLDFGKIAA